MYIKIEHFVYFIQKFSSKHSRFPSKKVKIKLAAQIL